MENDKTTGQEVPLCSPSTAAFIVANASADVRRLALQAPRHPDVDIPFALDQIAGRQTARRKLPSWAATDGVAYPPHLALEQCSSEATACYKAAVAQRLCGGGRLVDLTGGFGVDFAFMARGFDSATYVERQERLCAVARHNLPLLGLAGAEVVCADSADYLETMPKADLIYIDPARRNASGGRTYAIADCTPDVAQLRERLREKSRWTMVKLSPMLDWRKAVADMGGDVAELHIVAVGGECKELLLVVGDAGGNGMRIHCVNDGTDFCFDASEAVGDGGGKGVEGIDGLAGMYLYEPHAALMKAGCFGLLCWRFGVRQVAHDSHLFVSAAPVAGFPGRCFVIEAATTMNKRALRQALGGIDKANITVRNFPMDVAALRRRTKISEGGSIYIFATTLADGTHALLVCARPVL